jgi:cyclopropane fatty-acyl-phospholipid synthase-like methyltransferase
MENYLKKNSEYYEKGYEAENIESYVFRFYGRILKHDFKMDGSKNEKILDFGCGAGSALNFFKSKGFNVHGVDISVKDINRAKTIMPDIKNNLLIIDPKPKTDDYFFNGNFDFIISIQTLYFLSDTDLQVRLKTLYNMMKPGAYIYASMMGTKSYFFEHSKPVGDGLYEFNFSNDRIEYKNFYINFTKNKDDLEKKFSLFKKIYIGHYDRDYRNEGSEFHYTFVGQKI